MYYEIYADSLLLLHFFMNFYLLALVNRLLYKAASYKRLAFGALLGTICTVFPIIIPIPFQMSRMIGFLLSVFLMCRYTFRVTEKRQMLKIMEKMVIITLVLGGILRLILKYSGGFGNDLGGVFIIIGLAFPIYWLTGRLLAKKRETQCECKVILHKDSGNTEISALLDTGNSLVEPISGSPVSVAEPETLLDMLGGIWTEGYRIVPFNSVGKQHGLMKTYLIKSIWVEVGGCYKECRNVYIGESNEFFGEGSRYQIILNPGILEGGE